MIKLASIYAEILKEVGDLNNIEGYPYEKDSDRFFHFSDSDGDYVEVAFELFEDDMLNSLNRKLPDGDYYSVGYDVELNQSQHKKSDYRNLLRIIKTVVEITVKFVKEHPSLKGFIIFGTAKDMSVAVKQTDEQKDKLYKSVVYSKLSSMNFYLVDRITIDGNENFKGFALIRK